MEVYIMKEREKKIKNTKLPIEGKLAIQTVWTPTGNTALSSPFGIAFWINLTLIFTKTLILYFSLRIHARVALIGSVLRFQTGKSDSAHTILQTIRLIGLFILPIGISEIRAIQRSNLHAGFLLPIKLLFQCSQV